MNQGIQTDLIHYGVSAELRDLISRIIELRYQSSLVGTHTVK
jgi:hypothetical protein